MWAAVFAVLPVTTIWMYLHVTELKVSVTLLLPVFVQTTVFQFEPSLET